MSCKMSAYLYALQANPLIILLIQHMRHEEQHFLLKIQSEFIKLSNWEYFEPAIALSVIVICFVLGRKTYESRFSHILNIINDSENQKRRLKEQSQSKTTSLKSIRDKLTLFKIFTFAILLMAGIYLYLTNFKVNVEYLIWIGAALAILWTLVIIRIQYLEIMVRRTNLKLQSKTMSTEADAKEVMNLLGERICSALKMKFEREMQVQAQQEAVKECDLKKCADQKKSNKQLYQTYKNIIAEMQQMSWCDTCVQGLNIEANDLKIAEIELRLRTYRDASGSVGLPKKKELTNKLLEEYENLRSKLGKICRRGCCIRFRVLLEEIKRRYHNELQATKGKLR